MIVYPEIDPVAISFGPVTIHWYGLMYLTGFALVWILGMHRAKQADSGWTKQQVEDLVFFGAVGLILGARIGYILFYNFSAFIDNPVILFKVWQGGMSFHGGALGVMAALVLFARKYNKQYFDITDFMLPLAPPGLMAGRMGNFINAELPGRVADPDLPWAFVYPHIDNLARHPSSLYQALTEGLLLFIILWLFSSSKKPRMAVSGLFLLAYGCFRFTTEFFREPDAHMGFVAFDWMSQGQVLSIPMIIAGMTILLLAYRKQGRSS
ncbi:MAG: prolipoprotein diacylglyceryl transferase [Gammaproteobacteria bacterium]|nr:prolipoprotein diacylglyceryl transferase [Gammaproteobacteria bacterium]